MKEPVSRHDGWTVDRRARFLARLRATRSVSDAADHVGLSRASVYALRARSHEGGFAAAWAAALAIPPIVAPSDATRAAAATAAAARSEAIAARMPLAGLSDRTLLRRLSRLLGE